MSWPEFTFFLWRRKCCTALYPPDARTLLQNIPLCGFISHHNGVTQNIRSSHINPTRAQNCIPLGIPPQIIGYLSAENRPDLDSQRQVQKANQLGHVTHSCYFSNITQSSRLLLFSTTATSTGEQRITVYVPSIVTFCLNSTLRWTLLYNTFHVQYFLFFLQLPCFLCGECLYQMFTYCTTSIIC